MMKANAETLREFYNNNFFTEEGEAKPVKMNIHLELENETLILPNCTIQVHHSLQDIIKGYYHFLASQKDEVVFEPSDTSVLNFERIKYNDNFYMVEMLKDESYLIKNMETGKELNSNSPTAKAVIKLFKEQMEEN